MNLEAILVCWSNIVLILKQCLTFECLLKWSWKQPCLIILWYHQNLVFKHSQSPPFWWWQSLSSEFFSALSKPALFTFSLFLMMRIIIKQILFGIIKTWNLHDSQNYQQSHQQPLHLLIIQSHKKNTLASEVSFAADTNNKVTTSVVKSQITHNLIHSFIHSQI